MKQMTKEEAYKLAAGLDGRATDYGQDYVDLLIALGLWTPTEPKSVEDEAIEALRGAGWYHSPKLMAELKAAGFTVTKATRP